MAMQEPYVVEPALAPGNVDVRACCRPAGTGCCWLHMRQNVPAGVVLREFALRALQCCGLGWHQSINSIWLQPVFQGASLWCVCLQACSNDHDPAVPCWLAVSVLTSLAALCCGLTDCSCCLTAATPCMPSVRGCLSAAGQGTSV